MLQPGRDLGPLSIDNTQVSADDQTISRTVPFDGSSQGKGKSGLSSTRPESKSGDDDALALLYGFVTNARGARERHKSPSAVPSLTGDLQHMNSLIAPHSDAPLYSLGPTHNAGSSSSSRQSSLYTCSICDEQFESRALKPPIRHTCKGRFAGRHGIGRPISDSGDVSASSSAPITPTLPHGERLSFSSLSDLQTRAAVDQIVNTILRPLDESRAEQPRGCMDEGAGPPGLAGDPHISNHRRAEWSDSTSNASLRNFRLTDKERFRFTQKRDNGPQEEGGANGRFTEAAHARQHRDDNVVTTLPRDRKRLRHEAVENETIESTPRGSESEANRPPTCDSVWRSPLYSAGRISAAPSPSPSHYTSLSSTRSFPADGQMVPQITQPLSSPLLPQDSPGEDQWTGQHRSRPGSESESEAERGRGRGDSALAALMAELNRKENGRREEWAALVRQAEETRRVTEMRLRGLASWVESTESRILLGLEARRKDTEILRKELLMLKCSVGLPPDILQPYLCGQSLSAGVGARIDVGALASLRGAPDGNRVGLSEAVGFGVAPGVIPLGRPQPGLQSHEAKSQSVVPAHHPVPFSGPDNVSWPDKSQAACAYVQETDAPS